MTRPYRFPFIETFAIFGILVGAWLIQQTFQPTSELPNRALLAVGGLDILFCFGVLGYRLRERLRGGEGLSRGWIIGASILLAGFLGWTAALMLDAERLFVEEKRHRDYDQQLAKLEDCLRHFSEVAPASTLLADKNAWQANYDRYTVLHGQLQSSLRGNAAWEKDLARVDEQVQTLQKQVQALLVEQTFEQRVKGRNEFQQTREKADQLTETLRNEIAQSARDLAAVHRVRWQSVGASALTSIFVIIGCMLMWFVFNRELQRSWKREAHLAIDEARYRQLVEGQSDAVAVLDANGAIAYVNPAWKTAFGYEPEDILGRRLMDLIHADDRPRVYAMNGAVTCRLSADYGIWHDVEMSMQRGEQSSIVRFHDLRETSDVPVQIVSEAPPNPVAQQKLTDLEAECQRLRAREEAVRRELQQQHASEEAVRRDLEQQRGILQSHQHANSEGVLILSADGQVLSWNPSFLRLWNLSEETMTGHSWLTIAAHMETQVNAGWDELKQTAADRTDASWRMTLEGSRTLEVYTRVMNDQPGLLGAVQFHFRDVTHHEELEANIREHHERADDWRKRLDAHAEEKQAHEARLHELNKHVKHLEKQLRDREEMHADLESTLRDHQDRLHHMHRTHEDHAATLKASKEAARRLASGVANEFNTVLSVVLGNTDVLRENLPKDHMAQNYVDEIRQAAGRGTELSQRLLAFSRNHLLQAIPLEVNEHLTSLEAKMQAAVGHAVKLHWHPSNDEVWIKTDPHPLEQAILHVVAHARQHMPSGGTLTVRAKHVELTSHDLTHADMSPGIYCQLSIEDTGAGIDNDKLAHVFEPYHPIADGHKGDLSLATAYGIIRQSGGTIEVASEPGVGTEWSILLPITEERPRESAIRVSA